jgi:hypothetical protein
MLDTGTRIRRKGPRYTEIDESTLRANIEDIIWGVEEGYIELFSSDEKPLSVNDILALVPKTKSADSVPQPVRVQVPNDPDIKAKESPETTTTSTASPAKPVQVFAKKKTGA